MSEQFLIMLISMGVVFVSGVALGITIGTNMR